ncbi:MAG: SxtJ family membrane protein [Methylococcales bacterium]
MDKAGGTHERFDKRDDVKAPAERSFGITFAVVFALLAAFTFWHRGATSTFYTVLTVSAVFAGVTWLAPRLLRPLNLIWLKFGLLLHKVVNPVIMGLLFFGVFTPMGVVMRAFGVDLLRLKRKPVTETYWIARRDESIHDSSMKNQF